MGNFNRGGGDRPRRDFGGRDSGRSSFGGGGRGFDRGGSRDGGRGGDREMFKAVCSECGKDCQVPFRPTGSKPVYCSDCFEKKGGGEHGGRFEDRGGRPNFERRNDSQPQNNAQLEAISRKLDKILDLLVKPQVGTVKTVVTAPEMKIETKPEVIAEKKVVEPKKVKTPKKKAPTIKE